MTTTKSPEVMQGSSHATSNNALDELNKMFFVEEKLTETFKIMCMCKTSYENDTLTTVVTQLCTSDVQIKFTEQGYVPFHNHPLLVIPYMYMTKEQIRGIKKIVDDLSRQQVTFRASSMMGGGASITCSRAPARIIDPVNVLFTLYHILSQHCKQINNPSLIYNTIVQRLACNVDLSRACITQARNKIKSHLQKSREVSLECV
jgi:hypothetical protein|tara:strand:+ start:1981 stop:2589 length:609 start_codon:yes stop_codon:yes gene_type:complete